MEIGLHLPQFQHDPALLTRIARRAEEAGYASLWVSDHVLTPAQHAAVQVGTLLEPVATLAFVAAVTRRIRLATSVLVLPYRSPIVLAKELATLDRLCGGRLVVGVGGGWMVEEFRALGAPYERRGAFCDEAIRLMRTLWANEVSSFHGEFFNFDAMRCAPTPAAARIPIWVGGLSRRALRRAVELGDGWHGTRMRPLEMAERLKAIREIAAARGRALDGFALSHRVYIGFAERWTETGGYVRGILAPPAELAAHLNEFAELGVGEVLITPIALDRTGFDGFFERFERDVRPLLR